MLVSTRLPEPTPRPGRLELAIREWQRQLIEMADAAKRQAAAPAVNDYRWPEGDLFDLDAA